MVSVVVQGRITPEGKLEVNLPSDMPPGQVEVEIRRSEETGVTLAALLDSGLVGIWQDRADITDSVEFARSLRRRASRRDAE